ncbi:hypothetical protein [Brevibacterium atlanticum]|uniref:hypothetical protein n=1 Tax=Brevibacterium atlanticum TaxID=2697563 RepID=UPI00142311E0|nr:hypothetical protein [Brevibacterium atlanticum]
MPKEVEITIVDTPNARANELPSAELNIATVLMLTEELASPTLEQFQDDFITGGCPYSHAERSSTVDGGPPITLVEQDPGSTLTATQRSTT